MLFKSLFAIFMLLVQMSCTLSASISSLDSLGSTNKAIGENNSDVTLPSVILTSSPASFVIVGTITITATFSEEVTGFNSSQLAASNGVVQNFSGSGSVYTFDFVPAAEGPASVSVLSGSVKDSDSNLLPTGYVINKYYDKDITRAYFVEKESIYNEGDRSILRTIRLTRSKPYDVTVHVDFIGTAIKGSDYTMDPFDLLIPAGADQATFNVDLFDNAVIDQADRKLILNISDTSTAMLKVQDPSSSIITILENDKSLSYGLVEDVTVGYYHSCIRYQSGVVKCWGFNSYGSLGIGTTTDVDTPTVVDSLTPYTQIAAGARATCGILSSTGKLKCWGWNGFGELGDGTYTQRSSPVAIDASTTYIKIALGGSSNSGPATCGITSSFDLKCWGDNSYAQFGNGNYVSSLTPVAVQAGLKYSDISVGGLFSCGISTTGSLFCWGLNSDGQLGNGTSTDSSVPVAVDSGTSYTKVSAGGYHTCAITSVGVLKCWGMGTATGTNLSGSVTVPTVVDPGTTYAVVSAGEEGGCAITTTGVLKCWGLNQFGQVGNSNVPVGSSSYQMTPVIVDSGISYSKVEMQRAWSGGSSSIHVCAVTTTGDLKCWGSNDYSQAGKLAYVNTPRLISNDSYSQMSVYYGKLLGLTSAGKYFGLGSNLYGEYTDSLFRSFLYPFRMFVSQTFSSVSVSLSICGITQAQDLYCWGSNSTGEVGDATTINKSNPVLIDSGTKYVKVDGDSTKCAITTSGALKCWGANLSGQVGDGSTVNKSSPVLIDSGTNYVDVKSRNQTTCGITTTGALKCWGANFSGQVGDGTTINKLVPTLINSGTSYSSIEIYGNLNCGITTTGVLKCWGFNMYGAVGDGTTVNKTTPTVINSGTSYSFVKTALSVTCGITTANDLKCWGRNIYGAVGDGTIVNKPSPVIVDSGVKYSLVSTSGSGTCGITSTNDLKCWGRNNVGNVGDGTFTTRTSPVVIDSGIKYSNVVVTLGLPGTCGLTQSGKIKCWGEVVDVSTVYNTPVMLFNIH